MYTWLHMSTVAVEEDTVGEQQAEVDTTGELQLKQMQLGRSLV